MNDILKNNYYYKRITKKWEYNLIQTKNKSLEEILSPKLAKIVMDDNTETYLIISDYQLIGFFTIKSENFQIFSNIKCDILRIFCIYIYEKYQLKGVGREILNDIQWSMKHNSKYNYEYIISNSFIESIMFFLKNGFDFYKKRNKENQGRKIILMYKKVN